jgi:hypothetical protein
MSPPPDLGSTIIAAWRTNCLVNAHLIEQLPTAVWEGSIRASHPGAPSA